MKFLYAEDLPKLMVQCPPPDYKPLNIGAFRWVFDEIKNPENFTPLYYKNPSRVSTMDDLGKCQSMALSMYDSIESSKKRFKVLKNQIGNKVYKTLGTKIAFENITYKDGVNGAIAVNGHFSHHPFIGCDYENRFVIVEQLP